MFLLSIIIKLPYQIYIPGGIVNLGDRVSVEDGYNSKGSINSSYVSAIDGKPLFVLLSYIIPDWDLVKKEDITYDNETLDEAFKRDQILMGQSNIIAQIVALKKANIGYEIYDEEIKVLYTFTGNNNNLMVNDQIIEIDNTKINSLDDLKLAIADKKIDDTVSIKVIRNNKEVMVTSGFMEYENQVILGLYLTNNYDINPEKKISVKNKNDETGSSGGFMTALAIYNALTKEDITNEKKIVGTGTIDIDGNVGEIGGVKYKLMGAVKNKADIFLCPQENYDEAIEVKKQKNYDIEIYKINNFDEAIELLKKL